MGFKNVNGERISLDEFRKYRFAPIIPVHDLKDLNGDRLSESFPYWRKHELLPFIPKGSWNIEISLAQLIWLRMLDQLRAFSYKVNDTQQLCNYLFKDAYFAELPAQNLKAGYESLAKKDRAGVLNAQEAEIMKAVERMLGDPFLLHGLKFEINYLTELIAWCIDYREEAGLLIFIKGECLELRGSQYFSHREFKANPSFPHIYLSIRFFLEEFLEDDDLATIVTPQLLNEEEKMVLKELRDKNINQLEIKIDKGKILRINSTQIKSISGEKMNEIRKVIGLSNYEEITISTRDNKNLTFKRTKKRNVSG
jgi:hypothetical protein